MNGCECTGKSFYTLSGMMLDTFFWKSRDQKERFNKKQNVELTMLPQADDKGRLGICLRQQCQFLTLAFLLKTFFLDGTTKNKAECHQ